MKDFRWLHFSDLHLAENKYEPKKAKEMLIEYLAERKERGELKYDYVFITGDVANQGKYDGAEIFMKDFYNALDLKKEDLGKRVFWAVGNHDIERNKDSARTNTIHSIRTDKNPSEKFRSCLIETTNCSVLTDSGMKLYFKHSKKIANRTFSEKMINDIHQIYHLAELDLVVINTCLASCDGDDSRKLHIKSDHLRKVLSQTQKSKPVFVIGHHGRDFFYFEDMEELSTIFEDNNVDVYLCGHNHELGFALFPDTERDIYQFTCGGGPQIGSHATFSFMHGHYISTNNEICITPHSFRETDKKWSLDTRLNRRLAGKTVFPLKRLVTNTEIYESKSEDYVNILHLSDLQFGITDGSDSGKKRVAIGYRERVIEKSLIYYLSRLPDKWKPNIIVISGDLAWNAKKEDYQKCADWIKKLTTTLNVEIENVIVCTGNHDINLEAAKNNYNNTKSAENEAVKKYEDCTFDNEKARFHKYESIISHIIEKQAEEELTDDAFEGEKSLYNNFKEFISFCKGEIDEEVKIEPLKNEIDNNLDVQYLYGYREIMGIRFNVLNSSWYCVDRKSQRDSSRDKERLFIGKQFVDELVNNFVMNDKFSVTVFHHPFEWLNPSEGDDDSKVRQSILKLSDIILCGHVHTKVGEPTFTHNQAQIFQSGALWDENEYTYETRIIRINKRSGSVRQHVLEYDTTKAQWVSFDGSGPNAEDKSYPIHFPKHNHIFASGIREIDL